MEKEIEKLKKRQWIMGAIIVILAVLCVACFFYGKIQSLQATKNLEVTNRKSEELEQCKQDLFKAKMIAQQSAEEARKQHQRAEEALKEVSKK